MFEVEHRGGGCTRQGDAVVEGREGNGELGNLLVQSRWARSLRILVHWRNQARFWDIIVGESIRGRAEADNLIQQVSATEDGSIESDKKDVLTNSVSSHSSTLHSTKRVYYKFTSIPLRES